MGTLQFLVMPFGVTHAPTQFMNMMNDLLGAYLNKFVLVFLIYSANPQDHVEHLKKVLGNFKEHWLYAKASKYEILKTSVDFFGQQIYRGGMTPTEVKTV